jgi:hypothetical protein
MLLDHLLGYVLEELDSGVPVELPWGEETRRLAPTMAACLEDRGMFPPPAEAPPAVADSSAAPVVSCPTARRVSMLSAPRSDPVCLAGVQGCVCGGHGADLRLTR